MDDDRPPAEQPTPDAVPPTTPPPPSPWSPPPTSPPPPPTGPAVSWGPPTGTVAPVNWAVVEAPVLPPPPGTTYAGGGIRFLAFILDLIPLIVLGAIVVGPVFGDFMTTIAAAMPARPSVGRNIGPELQAAMAEAMTSALPGFLRASALFQVGGLLYIAGSWLAFSRTPGMALLGLRIVREEDGGRLTPARVAVRYGGYLLSALPLLLGFAWAFFDSRKQAWHDKLAGTVVVRAVPQVAYRAAPSGSPWPSPYDQQPAPVRVAVPTDAAPSEAAPTSTLPPSPWLGKRPSVGAVAEAAAQAYGRSPLDLLASLAVVLIPTMIVVLPLLAAYLIVAQNQSVISLQSIGDVLNSSGGDVEANYSQILENNRRALAAGAPAIYLGIIGSVLLSVASALLIGASAAAVDDTGAIRSPSTVTKQLGARLPALLTLGGASGALLAVVVLVSGLPALSAASSDPGAFDPTGASLGAVLATLVLVPLSLYFSAVWLLSLVCVVREELGAAAAFSRAWQLSRGRMRWLIGISIGGGLAVYAVLGPVGLLPIGLFAEQYISGLRLPVALSVITLGLLTMVSWPLLGLLYVAAYRAARDDASSVAPV
jgi:uncharacterized RDD family membrane protein YckC